jgi:hypothetical protein
MRMLREQAEALVAFSAESFAVAFYGGQLGISRPFD